MPAPIVLRTLTPETKKVVNPPTGQPVIATKAEFRDGTRVQPPPMGLLFAPDFNAEPDWQIAHAREQYSSVGYNGGDGSRVPAGFDFMYSAENWHPNGNISGVGAVAGSQPVGQINNSVDAASKALIIYDESYGDNAEWGSDMILTKEFDSQYQEIFAEVKIRFQPDWVWASSIVGTGQSMIKVLRIGNFRGAPTDNRYTFNTGENVGPLVFLDVGEWTFNSSIRGLLKTAIRHSPYTTSPNVEGFFDDAQTSAATYLGDGQWHTIGMHMVMNSAAGVGDGSIKVWLDGSLRCSDTTIEWNKSADLNGIGLNSVQIGGNASNVPFPEADKHEQWWALKDLKVYSGLPQEYQ